MELRIWIKRCQAGKIHGICLYTLLLIFRSWLSKHKTMLGPQAKPLVESKASLDEAGWLGVCRKKDSGLFRQKPTMMFNKNAVRRLFFKQSIYPYNLHAVTTQYYYACVSLIAADLVSSSLLLSSIVRVVGSTIVNVAPMPFGLLDT